MSILLSLQAVGSQAADQMPDLTAVTLPTEAEINVIDLAFKGGWIMVVLLLLSLMAIYIFVQRLIIIRRAGKEDETFMNRIKDYIHEGKVDSALNLCRSTNTPSARMIEKGITRLGRPMNDVLVAIENVGNLEIAKLEKGFPLNIRKSNRIMSPTTMRVKKYGKRIAATRKAWFAIGLFREPRALPIVWAVLKKTMKQALSRQTPSTTRRWLSPARPRSTRLPIISPNWK